MWWKISKDTRKTGFAAKSIQSEEQDPTSSDPWRIWRATQSSPDKINHKKNISIGTTTKYLEYMDIYFLQIFSVCF